MKKIFNWYNNLSKRARDSIAISLTIVGMLSTILSILGISLGDWRGLSVGMRICVAFVTFLVICGTAYFIIGKIFEESIDLHIGQISVSITHGDIFKTLGWRVIGCDTHFDTRVDDIVISKKSLHGRLVLDYGNKAEIEKVVEAKAKEMHLKKTSDGLYEFPLGTIIRYDSGAETYLLLAMCELDENHESHSNMAEFEQLLIKMWKEISKVYASYDVVLPVLGSGITRFDDGLKDRESLLRCMLWTLNSSGVQLNSKIKLVVFGDEKDTSLYEYKDLFHLISKG